MQSGFAFKCKSSSSLFYFEYLLWMMNDIVEILKEMKIMMVNLSDIRLTVNFQSEVVPTLLGGVYKIVYQEDNSRENFEQV